jgi:hypothetical protein
MKRQQLFCLSIDRFSFPLAEVYLFLVRSDDELKVSYVPPSLAFVRLTAMTLTFVQRD